MKNERTSSGWLSWRFIVGSALFWILYVGVSMSATALQAPQGNQGAWLDLAGFAAFQAGLYTLATPVMFEIAWRLGRNRPPLRRYSALLIATVAVPALVYSLLAIFTTPRMETESPGWYLLSSTLWTSFHFAAILGAAVTVNEFRLAEARRRDLLDAQLRALRSQLQPHFLFNTLQAIAVTTKRDPNAAVGMLALLGDLLRQTLRERASETVSLAEENELLQPYLELQRLRFADRLQVEVDLPADVLTATVPDLILQPLVENALQHGIEHTPGAGTVRIRARRDGETLELQVADDGAGPDREAVVDGIGLGATRARLQALFGDRAGLELDAGGLRGTVVTVRLPWQEVERAA